MNPLVTTIIPAKNDAAKLVRCLPKAKVLGRVIVVDSGSLDKTNSVCRDFGVECVDFRWNGRFPKKRNWALRNLNITSPWVLFLDADEIATDAFASELERTLPHTTHQGFTIRFENQFMGKTLKRGDALKKVALFRTGSGEYERIDEDFWSMLDMEVHEHPILSGTLGVIHSPVLHEDDRGLHHYISKHNHYSDWEAHRWFALKTLSNNSLDNLTKRQLKKYKHLDKAWFHIIYFIYSYFWKNGWMDGSAGFHFAKMKSIYFYQIRLKILEMKRGSSTNEREK